MSDARSLLRQQRAARRITHQHAAYSDTGKLLCTLCREHIKSDSLWDVHVQGEAHRRRQLGAGDGRDDRPGVQKEVLVTSHKRKHGEDSGVGQDGAGADNDGNDDDDDEGPRRKRSRADMASPTDDRDGGTAPSKDHRTRTPPPALSRRSSQTPSQGVEIQIPSRPATPRDSTNVSSSSSSSAAAAALPSRQLVTGPPMSDAGKPGPGNQAAAATTKPQQQVDEDEWAAFEADLADEREDAARALEDELDEMRGLEAKVLRLKERRESLRQRAASHGQDDRAKATAAVSTGPGKENAAVSSVAVAEEDEDESDDDDDEDDWDGFRFRTGLAR